MKVERENAISNAVSAEQENAQEVVDAYEGQYKVEEMAIAGNDETIGTSIYARAYLPVNGDGPYPTVIMSHGIGGTYKNCEPYAKQFASRGAAAVAFDFCGGGLGSKSDGKMRDMSTLTEWRDLSCVTDAVQQMDFVDQENLFLLGESMGGFVSAYTAARRPDDYRAIVLFYPAFVLQDDAWAKFPGGPQDAPEVEVIYGMETGRQSYIDNMSFDIYEAIGYYQGDVLIVHGYADPVVPLKYSERALGVYASAKLVVIPGASHGYRGNDIQTAGTVSLDFVLERVR